MRRWITGIPCFAGGHLIQHCATPPLRLAETARAPGVDSQDCALSFRPRISCRTGVRRANPAPANLDSRTKPFAPVDRPHSGAFWQEALRQIYAKIMLHRRTASDLCSESWRYGAPDTNRTCHLPLRSRLGALFKINSLQQRVLFLQLLTLTLDYSEILHLTLCLRQIYAQLFSVGVCRGAWKTPR